MLNKIMRLAFNNSEIWKQIKLTAAQRKVLRMCSCSTITSVELSNITGRSMRHSSMMLRTLYDKGYLTREAVTRGVDGVVLYYIYQSDQTKWGK